MFVFQVVCPVFVLCAYLCFFVQVSGIWCFYFCICVFCECISSSKSLRHGRSVLSLFCVHICISLFKCLVFGVFIFVFVFFCECISSSKSLRHGRSAEVTIRCRRVSVESMGSAPVHSEIFIHKKKKRIHS